MLLKSKPRRTLVALHRYAGLFTAFFLLTAGVTGTLIAFYHEFDRGLNPDLYHVAERPWKPLGPDELAGRLNAAFPQAFVSQLMLDREPGESVHVYLTARKDPISGELYKLR